MGVLSQLNAAKDEQVLSYTSHSLPGAELKYTTTEKELFGIIFGLQNFRTYAQGVRLIIHRDHHAFKFLKQYRLLNEGLTEWILILQQFDYHIEHIPGNENVVADPLSRFLRAIQHCK